MELQSQFLILKSVSKPGAVPSSMVKGGGRFQ